MNGSEVLVRKTANYRIWVDETSVGRMRILKRINFKTFVALFGFCQSCMGITFELVLIEM